MLIDRYLLQRILLRFASILVCIVAILLLENIGRLLNFLEHVRKPLQVLARFSFYLLPEYLGIGILLALFLSIALTLRSLALRGEWQIFAAAGISPARLSMVPLLIGLFCATAEIGIHFHFRPAGEYELDSLISDIRRGLYGLGGNVREFVRLDNDTIMTADSFDHSTHKLINVFIVRKNTVLAAGQAEASFDDAGNLNLLLENGQSLAPRSEGGFFSMNFARLRINLVREDRNAQRRVTTALDRLSYTELIPRIQSERATGTGARAALSSLASRCAYAALCLFLPFLALLLGALPVRGSSPYGIGVGILSIVGYIRVSSYVETAAADYPLVGFGTLVCICSGMVALGWRAESLNGPGSVETWFAQRLTRPINTITTWICARLSG
ncbi:hypothetical protein CAF53_23730 [Sphingobium sp. LB126]|uniref:LptF/LptG family permease n=1 Tax=Sphingobium sp. LB126 TaxID=1983755 RepID=UPI000C20D916|nr:LptF/LptG family permease [Sphingobium sp. LB126]PJG45709.1 hypothetical protein CAF53_23730 [Sphingobium sp. LB126]